MSEQPVRDAIDRFQQARPLTAVPCAVAKKFTDDGASRLAALIAYWAFFSIFPLLLAFASILGFLLEGNPDFQKDVLDSTVAQIPVIGEQLSQDVTSLKGSGVALAIGIVGAVWAGLGVTRPPAGALDTLWAVPAHRPARLRALACCAGWPSSWSSARRRSSRRSSSPSPATATIQPAGRRDSPAQRGRRPSTFPRLRHGVRVLTAADVTTRQVLPGASLATISWLGLQTLGGLYVEHVVAQSSATYGVFARSLGCGRGSGRRRSPASSPGRSMSPRPAPVAAVALRRPRGGR